MQWRVYWFWWAWNLKIICQVHFNLIWFWIAKKHLTLFMDVPFIPKMHKFWAKSSLIGTQRILECCLLSGELPFFEWFKGFCLAPWEDWNRSKGWLVGQTISDFLSISTAYYFEFSHNSFEAKISTYICPNEVIYCDEEIKNYVSNFHIYFIMTSQIHEYICTYPKLCSAQWSGWSNTVQKIAASSRRVAVLQKCLKFIVRYSLSPFLSAF